MTVLLLDNLAAYSVHLVVVAASVALVARIGRVRHPRALQAKVQGAVVLSVVAESAGTAGRIRVVPSLDQTYGLDQAAVDAVSQWRFEPGRKDGRPVPVQVAIEMVFTLRP